MPVVLRKLFCTLILFRNHVLKQIISDSVCDCDYLKYRFLSVNMGVISAGMNFFGTYSDVFYDSF